MWTVVGSDHARLCVQGTLSDVSSLNDFWDFQIKKKSSMNK